MAAKKTAPHGLGRGLGALLGDIENESELLHSETEQKGDVVQTVPLSSIDPNRDQPRKEFREESLKELADSIRAVGVIQPIVVTKRGNRYSIIAGERRWRASRMAGLNEVPVIVRDWDEMTRLKAALIENLQRDDLNPVEEALGIRALMDKCELTQEAASGVIGKSRSAIANSLRLLTLPDDVLALLKDGSLSAGHGRALVSVSPERQSKLAILTVQQGWSVRQLERICAQPEKKPVETPAPARRPAELGQLEKMAREVFGTRVKLDGDENKGKITLSYMSAEDLERIWDVLEFIRQSEQ
ncbi:MAG: ParB/RepB/Spo0J family partition protein [Eubacteriales bacterium]|nr:ParB/RepB/Spo0J family partition protein [Clostridiales bacterium]MDY2768860.1 ParB/RepB/Spo0J family partition protein [Eubacteriales bacterium]